jgi:hypothetical protein
MIRRARIALFIIVLLSMGLIRSSAFAASAGTLIFVIDSSENMSPHLPSAKEAIFTFIDQTEKGSTISLISFSDTATRLFSKKLSSPHDKESAMKRLDAVEAVGETGDVAAGLARALEEVRNLKRRDSKGRKGIIVISASESPAEGEPAKKLQMALENLSGQVGGGDWYIQYCFLGGKIDRPVADFVHSNNGLSHDIDALATEGDAEPAGELYQIFSSPLRLCPPKVGDLTGAILGNLEGWEEWKSLGTGSKIPEAMSLQMAGDSRAIIGLKNRGRLGLAPETRATLIEAKENPLTGKSFFSMRLDSGSVWMHLNPKLQKSLRFFSDTGKIDISGQSGVVRYSEAVAEFEVASFSDNFTVTTLGESSESVTLDAGQSIRIANGKIPQEPAPVQPALVEKWKPWKKALADHVSLVYLNFSVPKVTFPQESISLGPIKRGEILSREFEMKISGAKNPSKLLIDIAASIELPEGLILSTGIIEGSDPDSRILSLRLDGSSGFKSRREETHTGLIRLVPGQDSGAVFEKVLLPTTITTQGPLVPGSILLASAGGILFIIFALISRRAILVKSAMTARPHALIGRLIVIDDPTGGRVETVILENLGAKSSRLPIVIGRDRAAQLRLRHTSISSSHCAMEAYLVGGRLETHIDPFEQSSVSIDGELIRTKTMLHDGAQIRIGDFLFQFEDTQMYKKVEVVRGNGKRISGILDMAGMDAEGFRLSPMDAVSTSERARVTFSDIRYAIFYRRAVDMLSGSARSMPKTGSMKRVRLMFRKGNTISGYIQREYVEGRRRYAELLPLEPDSDIDYTIVDYSAVVEKKLL